VDTQDFDRSDREPRRRAGEDKGIQNTVLAIVILSVVISTVASGVIRRAVATVTE
jgi:hypothetical protein